MASMTDKCENMILDTLFRGQVLPLGTKLYVGLLTSQSNEITTGIEVSGGGYARVEIPRDLLSWAGTQGAGTTTASAGSSGITSNNVNITFPTPTADWGIVTAVGIYDTASGGLQLVYAPLATPKTVNAQDSAPVFTAGTLLFQIDN